MELFTASLSVLTPLTPVSDQDRNSPYYYLYNINQMSDENKENYQLWDYKLIQYQILQTNIMRIIWQTVRRISNEILVVKGLTLYLQYSILQIGCENRQGHLQSIS